uniref:Uncharacterized protein n=1 Tax=Panagrolaimus sp. ES5 TaxID=591445 RepID=A0AC34FRA2_9BILA
MDSSIEPLAIKRLGEKADGKKRIIAIEFTSKKKRNAILSKARDVIKNYARLSADKVYFNKFLPIDEQEIQFLLRKELKQ